MLIAVIIALVKIVDLVIQTLLKKLFPGGGWSDKEKFVAMAQLRRLYDMHNITDGDGTPIWYVPQALADNQQELVKTVSDIVHTQMLQTTAMERCAVILDRIDQRHV